MTDNFIDIKTDAILTAVKTAEHDKSALVLRFNEVNGKKEKIAVTFKEKVKSAYLSDFNEQTVIKELKPDGNKITAEATAYSALTLVVKF